ASTDQAPGPSSARAAPRVPNRMYVQGSPVCEKVFHSASTATSVPTMGVHKPAISRSPAAIESTWSMAGPIGGPARSAVTPWIAKAVPATTRIIRRPTPGAPCANVEKSRRKINLGKVTSFPIRAGSPKRLMRITLSSELKLYDSAPQTDHGGMGPVMRAQFGEDVPDLALDGLFANRELSSYLFVGIPFGNQPQDTDFRRGQKVIGGVLGKSVGGLSGEKLFPGMDGTDRFQEFLVQAIFQQVSPRTSFQGAQNLDVAGVGGQDDDARVGKLTANHDDRIETVHFRHQ